MSSSAFQRGMVLFEQDRFDLAEREFRQELAADPDCPTSHALLALCLSHRDQNEEALREADEAIRVAPDLAFGHYVRGSVLRDLERYREAEESAEEAIQLNPNDAGHFGLLASIQMARGRWDAALDSADHGLSLDPEHPFCANLRAMALVHLGRNAEAATTLTSALSKEPENSFTHANQGWALLHKGDHKQALEHFRESLRLEPENEWARQGIVEALKAHHFVYRAMLRFFLWIGRQGQVAQWGLILALVFGRGALASIADANPALKPFVTPLIAIMFAFVIMTWIASPLFNLLLKFNRFGRMALSRAQSIEANWVGGCFLVALGLFLANTITGSLVTLVAMTYFGFMLFPLSNLFRAESGRSRLLMGAATLVIALLGAPLLGVVVLGPRLVPVDLKIAVNLFLNYFVLGAVLSSWFPAIAGLRSANR